MISTKNIQTGGSGSVPKTLQPGNQKIKINKVYLQEYPYAEGAYHLMLDCEGIDMGESFEGFFIDKDNEALGRYAGQIGRVRASEWAFADKEFSDAKIERDLEILKFVKNLCDALECSDWLESANDQHETIEEFIMAFNNDAPFENKFLYACLAGKEYQNKAGYTNYDLFLPKFTRGGLPFENENVDSTVSRVYAYNEDDHIRRKKKEETVDSFEPSAGAPDFELG